MRLLPYLIFGTTGGGVADRYERRRVTIASGLVRAATMFVLAAVAASSGSVVLALVVVVVSVMGATPYQPALAAMTRPWFPRKTLPQPTPS